MRFDRQLACLILTCVLPPFVSASEKLSSPNRTVTVPEDYERPVPVITRGYVLYPGDEDGSVTVYATAEDQAKIVFQTTIHPEGSSIVRIYGLAAASPGVFASACGTSTTGAGAPNGGFIAFFGPGTTQVLVPLPSLGPSRIAFAGDGTLWALVREHDSTFNELAEYDFLRHYDASGKFLGSAIPRSSVKSASIPTSTASISASNDTIGVYFDRAGVWLELGYDGSVKGRSQVPGIQMSSGQKVTQFDRLELTGSNEVVRVSMLSGKENTDHVTRVAHLHKSDASLDSSPVDSSALPSRQPYFLGMDGDQFVWAGNPGKLYWSKLE
jgi:hypothetical protein